MSVSQEFTLESVRTVLLADVTHLSAMLRDLVELRNGPESDDYGTLRPTLHAFDVATSLLVDSAVGLAAQGREMPHGAASTDSSGGVRVEWVREQASVHLVVPAEEREPAYLYHEVRGVCATEDATPARLALWLGEID